MAICYLQKNPALALSDYLDVGSASAREMHAYRADQAIPSTVESSFIGNDMDVRQRMCGYEHPGGEIIFMVSIDGDTLGVMLRRRIDQRHGGKRRR